MQHGTISQFMRLKTLVQHFVHKLITFKWYFFPTARLKSSNGF